MADNTQGIIGINQVVTGTDQVKQLIAVWEKFLATGKAVKSQIGNVKGTIQIEVQGTEQASKQMNELGMSFQRAVAQINKSVSEFEAAVLRLAAATKKLQYDSITSTGVSPSGKRIALAGGTGTVDAYVTQIQARHDLLGMGISPAAMDQAERLFKRISVLNSLATGIDRYASVRLGGSNPGQESVLMESINRRLRLYNGLSGSDRTIGMGLDPVTTQNMAVAFAKELGEAFQQHSISSVLGAASPSVLRGLGTGQGAGNAATVSSLLTFGSSAGSFGEQAVNRRLQTLMVSILPYLDTSKFRERFRESIDTDPMKKYKRMPVGEYGNERYAIETTGRVIEVGPGEQRLALPPPGGLASDKLALASLRARAMRDDLRFNPFPQELLPLEPHGGGEFSEEVARIRAAGGAPTPMGTAEGITEQQGRAQVRAEEARKLAERRFRSAMVQQDIFQGSKTEYEAATMQQAMEEESTIMAAHRLKMLKGDMFQGDKGMYERGTFSEAESEALRQAQKVLGGRGGDMFQREGSGGFGGGGAPPVPIAGAQGIPDDDSGGGIFGKFGRRFGSLVNFLGAAAILYPLLSTLYTAVDNAKQLETIITRIQSLVGNGTIGERLAIRQEIVDVATTFAIDIKDAAQAAQLFAQQGESIAKVGEDLRIAAVGAQALGVSIEEAERLMISIRSITGDEATGTSIFDRIMGVRKGSPVSSQTLAEGLEQLLPLVRQMRGEYAGLVDDIDVVLGALATVSKETQVTGRGVSTSLRFVLGRLGNPANVNKIENLTGIGFGTPESAGTELRPIINILNDLAAAYQRLSAAHDPRALQLLQELAGSRQTRDVAVLLDHWTEVMGNAERAAYSLGSAEAAANRQLETTQNELTKIQANLSAFAEGIIGDSIASDALHGTLWLVNKALEGLNSGLGGAVLTLGLVALAVAGLNRAFLALRATSLVGGAATFLGVSTGTAALLATVAGSLLLIATAVEAIHVATAQNPLAIPWLQQGDLKGQAMQQITAFQDFAKSMGQGPAALFSGLGGVLEDLNTKFSLATGHITATRKALVDDFLNEVIKISPAFKTHIDKITEGMTPSQADVARLLEAQKLAGNLAYLTNAIGNAHYNQLLTAEQGLSGNVATGLKGLGPLNVAQPGFQGRTVLDPMAGILNAFNKLDPATREVSADLIQVLHSAGALDGVFKDLNTHLDDNVDRWGKIADAIDAAITGPQRGTIIKDAATKLISAFNADPKKFPDLLGFGSTGAQGGVEHFADSFHTFLQKVLAEVNNRLKTNNTLAPLAKSLSDFLSKDSGGVRAVFDTMTRGVLKASDPLAKFLEDMFLTLRAVDANAEAARNLGLGYDYLAERLNAVREIGKKFYELPITSFKEYLNLLQQTNALEAQLPAAQRLASGAHFLSGLAGPNGDQATAAQDQASTNLDQLNKNIDLNRRRLLQLGTVMASMQKVPVAGLQDNTLSLFAQRGIGPTSDIYKDFISFIAQFAQHSAAYTKAVNDTAKAHGVSAEYVMKHAGEYAELRKAAEDWLADVPSIEEWLKNTNAGLVTLNVNQQKQIDIMHAYSNAARDLYKAQEDGQKRLMQLDLQIATSGRRKGNVGEDLQARLANIVAEQQLAIQSENVAYGRSKDLLVRDQALNPTQNLDAFQKALNKLDEEHRVRLDTLSTEQLIRMQYEAQVVEKEKELDYAQRTAAAEETRLGIITEFMNKAGSFRHTRGVLFNELLGPLATNVNQANTKQLTKTLFDSAKGMFPGVGDFLGTFGVEQPIYDAHVQGVSAAASIIIAAHQEGMGAAAPGSTAALAGSLGGSNANSINNIGGVTIPALPGSAGAIGTAVAVATGLAAKHLHDFIGPNARPSTAVVAAPTTGKKGPLEDSAVDTQAGEDDTAPTVTKGQLFLEQAGMFAGNVGGAYLGGGGPNAQLGSNIGSTAGAAIGSIGGPVGMAIGGLLGGLLGGAIGGASDHPQQPQRQALDLIAANTREQVNLLQNTNRLLQLQNIAFNVPTGFNLPIYNPGAYGANASGGNRASIGMGGTSNNVQVTVQVGIAGASAHQIGAAVADAVSGVMDSQYRTGSKYISTRTRF